MRLLRVLTTATAFAAVLAQPSAAQEGRPFKDAWFWGLKGGVLTYTSGTEINHLAPVFGVDWFITRTQGGMYVSFDQSIMSTGGIYVDRDVNNTAFNQIVTVTNLRSVNFAAMLFPGQTPRIHPYIGAGFGFQQLAGAQLYYGPSATTRPAIAADSIQSKRTTLSPLLLAGVQMRMPRFSVFGQAMLTPMQHTFFLSHDTEGRSVNFNLQGGIRYNVGSSIEGIR